MVGTLRAISSELLMASLGRDIDTIQTKGIEEARARELEQVKALPAYDQFFSLYQDPDSKQMSLQEIREFGQFLGEGDILDEDTYHHLTSVIQLPMQHSVIHRSIPLVTVPYFIRDEGEEAKRKRSASIESAITAASKRGRGEVRVRAEP
jgi:hypothetical protein